MFTLLPDYFIIFSEMYFVQLLLLIIIKTKVHRFFSGKWKKSDKSVFRTECELNDTVPNYHENEVHKTSPRPWYFSFKGTFLKTGLWLIVQCITFNFSKNIFLYFQMSKCTTPYLLVAKDFLNFNSHSEPNLDSAYLMNLQHLWGISVLNL